MKQHTRKTIGWPWLVIRPNGVDEYGIESEARDDAGSGGVVMPRSVALSAPAMLAALLEVKRLRDLWRSQDDEETIDSIAYMDGLDRIDVDAVIAAARGA